MFLLIILIITAVLYCCLLIFYRISWNNIKLDQETSGSKKHTTSVSVIIPARNEATHIGRCIQSILHQNYDNTLFEAIVIDDHSTDDTAAIAKGFLQKNIQLICLGEIDENHTINSYKKKAIEIGIEKASGDLIVCTDADCIAPTEWLSSLAGFYEATQAEFISAPVKFFKVKGEALFNRLLYIFQALDFTSLQEISGAATASGFHYMCNGANLAFTKKGFYKVGGYKNIDDIASGDDMLLMEKFVEAYPGKVKFIKSTGAIVETAPAASFKAFIQQRIRWASKAGRYKSPTTKIVLVIVYLLNVLLLFTAMACFFNATYLIYLACALLLKTVVEVWFLLPVTRFFGNRKLLAWFIAAVPFHIVYTVAAGAFGLFGKYEWKGRTVK